MTRRHRQQLERLRKLLEQMHDSGALAVLAEHCDTGGSVSDVRDACDNACDGLQPGGA